EKTGYLEALRSESTPEAEAREENLGELVSSIAEYASDHSDDEDAGLSAFLEEVSLMTSEDEVDEDGRGQTLTLMTLHSAKGLDFP
ncbi:MAG: 3'-5' exonuclease, partial [Candidatus Latescibacteria bacterium]|nr:3'-5' exonuclease [Candidatus Latescibacterota bacterium]